LFRKIFNLPDKDFAVPALLEEAAPCKLKGETYPHGSEIREGATILECVDGQWKERINMFVTVGP
jgi:hypothetical protein